MNKSQYAESREKISKVATLRGGDSRRILTPKDAIRVYDKRCMLQFRDLVASCFFQNDVETLVNLRPAENVEMFTPLVTFHAVATLGENYYTDEAVGLLERIREVPKAFSLSMIHSLLEEYGYFSIQLEDHISEFLANLEEESISAPLLHVYNDPKKFDYCGALFYAFLKTSYKDRLTRLLQRIADEGTE